MDNLNVKYDVGYIKSDGTYVEFKNVSKDFLDSILLFCKDCVWSESIDKVTI